MSDSTGPPHHTLSAPEALAGGVAVLPPDPPNAPLASTAGDVSIQSAPKNTPAREDEPVTDAKQPAPSRSASPISPLAPILSRLPARAGDSKPPEPPAFPSQPPLSPARLFSVAVIVTFTMILSAGGMQGLNIALPTIGAELNMRESDLQWVASAYSLTNGCFLLLAGRMADVHGRKLVFMVGVLWYAVWHLIGGFMHNGAALVVTRALAGCGAAMSTPSAIGIIATHFRGKARSTAFASFSAGAPVGAAFGLVVGGLPTAYSKQTWRPCLWILASLAFAIAIVAFFVIPTDVVQTTDRRVDWVGAALVTVGLVFVQFGISDGETAPQGWKTSYIIALLIIGVLLVIAFFLWERHVVYNTTRPPLMRLQLWTRANGRLAAVYAIGCTSWMGFSALFYHATLFYQQVQDTGAIGAMLRFIPCSVSGVLCNVLVAKLISKVRTQWIICTGILSTALASILMANAPADGSYWRLPFNAMWMAVLGADFLMATGSIFVAALALPDEQSVAGALFQTLVQLGGSFGLAITTVISTSIDNRSLSQGKPPLVAQLDGIHAAFWLGSGTSFVALGIAVVALRGMGVYKPGGGEGKGEERRANSEGDVEAAVGDAEKELADGEVGEEQLGEEHELETREKTMSGKGLFGRFRRA